MDNVIKWHKETIGTQAVEALKKNNFSAFYAVDRADALSKALSLISPEATIGVGGSATITALGIIDKLVQDGHTIFNHGQAGLSPDEAQDIRHKELACDVFLTSSNAITLDGQLVNTDGAGNRVAAMIFGPKRTIIIAGVNKIVKDLAAADDRIKMLAAPLNNKRLGLDNPCVKVGHCVDCHSPSRICNVTTILNRQPGKSDINIIIVGESLGF